MEKKIYHETASYYGDMLANVRDEILNSICAAVEWLGGKVCMRHYHEWADTDRYTFFEVDGDGYGRELFIDTVYVNEEGDVEVLMQDSEDSYNPCWELSDFNASNALYFLEELEQVISHLQETGEDVVKDYDSDYCPDEE